MGARCAGDDHSRARLLDLRQGGVFPRGNAINVAMTMTDRNVIVRYMAAFEQDLLTAIFRTYRNLCWSCFALGIARISFR